MTWIITQLVNQTVTLNQITLTLMKERAEAEEAKEAEAKESAEAVEAAKVS